MLPRRREATGRGRAGKALPARWLHRLHFRGFFPPRVLLFFLSTSNRVVGLRAALWIRLSSATGRRYWDQCHGRGSSRLPPTLPGKESQQSSVLELFALSQGREGSFCKTQRSWDGGGGGWGVLSCVRGLAVRDRSRLESSFHISPCSLGRAIEKVFPGALIRQHICAKPPCCMCYSFR